MVTWFRSHSHRPGAVSVKKSLGNGVGWSAPALAAKITTPRSLARACFVGCRPARYGASARGPRATGFVSFGHIGSKPQPPTWHSASDEKPQPTAWDGARPVLAEQATTPSPPARARSVGGRSVLHGAMRIQAVRHGIGKLWPAPFEAAAVDLARCRGRGASTDGVGWSAPSVGYEASQAKSASARVLSGRSVGYPRGDARAGRTPRISNASYTLVRSRSRRPNTLSVKKSLDRRRGLERVPRWLQYNHAKSASAHMLHGRPAGSDRGKARGGRAARRLTAVATLFGITAAVLARCR